MQIKINASEVFKYEVQAKHDKMQMQLIEMNCSMQQAFAQAVFSGEFLRSIISLQKQLTLLFQFDLFVI